MRRLPSSGGRVVLVVEDNPADARLVQETLSRTTPGTEVIVVGDGEEAMNFLRGQGPFHGAPRPDLVLL
ncbi:MAG: hypothetical protein R3185_00115, partial [Candidatus Thermoplasmatota archaeon]|nr:hypothetical protein [Candidatus Thermoplasmatota archaeon]